MSEARAQELDIDPLSVRLETRNSGQDRPGFDGEHPFDLDIARIGAIGRNTDRVLPQEIARRVTSPPEDDLEKVARGSAAPDEDPGEFIGVMPTAGKASSRAGSAPVGHQRSVRDEHAGQSEPERP